MEAGGLSLRTIVAALVLVLSAALAGVLVALRSAQLDEQAQESAGHLNLQQARGVAAALDAELDRLGHTLQAQAQLMEHTGALRQPALLQALLDQHAATPGHAWVGVTDAQGRVQAALQGRLVGADFSGHAWWSAAQSGLYFGDVHEMPSLAELLPSLPSGEPWHFLDVAVPLRDAGRVAGVLGLHLSWPWLRERATLFAGAAPAPGAQLHVIGRDGRQRLGAGGELGDALPLHALAAEAPQGWRVLAWPDGQRYVTAWATGHGSGAGMGWTTLVRTPLQALHAEQAPAMRWLLGASALAVAAATALAWALCTVFLLPLAQFVARVRGLADGGAPVPAPRLLPLEFSRLHAVTLELVTRLRHKEDELRTALEHVRGGFDNVGRALPGFLFTRVQHGNDAHYTFFSESALHYLGLSREELMADHSGRLWLRHVDPADVRRIVPQHARAMAEGSPITFVFRVRGGDGTWRHLQSSLVPREGARGSGGAGVGPSEFIFDGIALDITPLMEARTQALHASEAKDRFLATMSHELRTPLNGILGFARLLQARLEREDDRRGADHIVQAGQNLLRILNDVLDLSKIEAGRLELERLPLRLEEVARGCRDLFAAGAEAKGVQLDLLLPAAPLPALMGDALRLQQVLANLLSNAVKFTSRGRVALALATEGQDARGRILLSLAVSDTGIGLSDEQRQRLFEPFRQAETSTARRFGGTGLGLWISQRLVQAMEGEITVASAPGQGTVVTLRIPFEPALAASVQRSAVDFSPALPGLPLRVLVVDDVALNREVLRALLQLRGHVVEELSNGEAAVRRVGAGDIDLVLMDVEMPDCDGLQATRRIRAMENGAASTAVWAMTGRVFGHDIAQTREAGMDGHLSKPVDVAALDAVLHQVARLRHRSQDAARQAA